MLTVRKRNLIVLEEALQRSLGGRLVRYVMGRFPHVFGRGDEEAARAFVERARAAAAAYGVESEEDAATFVDLSVMYGEDFHRDPWAAEVLEDKELTPGAKMQELRGLVEESGALI